jgi:hypothetical protein
MTDYLTNEQLEIEILEPADYAGSRFDRTGFVTQVRLRQGNQTFCVPESLVAGMGTGGAGLCNEFGLFSPIGYEGTAAGDPFPKLGVGLLTRLDEGQYDFLRSYPVQPYPVEISRNENEIRYLVHPLDCRGFAVRMEKTLRLKDSSLVIDYGLLNVGTQTIATHEYVHNFIGLNGHAAGPDYSLQFGGPVGLESVEPDYTGQLLEIRPREVRWRSYPSRAFYCTFRPTPADAPYFWNLKHKPSGLCVRESGDFKAERIALWGNAHVISPEVFVKVKVEPGEFLFWSRKYEFYTNR